MPLIPTLCSVTRLNLCLSLEHRSRLWGTAQTRHMCHSFLLQIFVRLLLCGSFSSVIDLNPTPGDKQAPLRHPLLEEQFQLGWELSSSSFKFHLKIGNSLWRLNLWVSQTPGRTPERFGFRHWVWPMETRTADQRHLLELNAAGGLWLSPQKQELMTSHIQVLMWFNCHCLLF